MKELIKRDNKGLFRDPKEVRIRILRQLIVGLMMLAVFWKLDGRTKTEIMGLEGALFYVSTNQIMMMLTSAVL